MAVLIGHSSSERKDTRSVKQIKLYHKGKTFLKMIIPLIPRYFHHYIKYIVRVIIPRKVQRREKLLQNPMRKIEGENHEWIQMSQAGGGRAYETKGMV